MFQKRVEFQGRWVGPEGIQISESDVQVVVDWLQPKTTKEMGKFLGLVNYHHMFIPNYAQRSRPRLMVNSSFAGEVEQQQAFNDIMEALATAPVLCPPNEQDPFVLDTDASDLAIGAVLYQTQGHQGHFPRVICFNPKSNTAQKPLERNC